MFSKYKVAYLLYNSDPRLVEPREHQLYYSICANFSSIGFHSGLRAITPKPPSSLGKQTIVQAAFEDFLLSKSGSLYKQCFLNLSTCLMTIFW